MPTHWRLRLAALVAVVALLAGPARAAEADDVTLLAAASLAGAIDALVDAYAATGGGRVRTAFASSGALARQIEFGAPADIFISANLAWMDYLTQRGLIEHASRRTLLGNRLVLIAPSDSRLTLAIVPDFALVEALGGGRLAIADPAHAPVGGYAKSALRALGVWTAVASRLARSQDARATLALVARGAAPLGIVYATDAAITDRVRVVDGFPPSSHPPIAYPAALIADHDSAPARRFFDYLGSAEAGAVFEGFGFAVKR